MNQLLQPDRPKTAFETSWVSLKCGFEDVLFWVEDYRRPILGTLTALLLGATAFVSTVNQQAINEDAKVIRQAALEDGIDVDSIASGIRSGKVLANIVIGDCKISDSMLSVGYVEGVLHVDDYTVPTTIMTTGSSKSSQAIHVRNASDLRNIAPFTAVCK